MKKIIIIALTITLVIAGIVLKQLRKTDTEAAFRVGILQTASHPALDACRDAFIEELKQTMGNTVAFEIHNAQGSVIQAHALAQQLHANRNISLFYTIATPATQAMSTLEKERPIVFAAVTDPEALGLIKRQNISGVTDMINVKAEIEMLKALLPQAKRVAIIYTSGETNSIAMAQRMHTYLKELGLDAFDFAVASEADIPAIVELACRKTDVLLAPTDNTVASTIALISAIALKYNKPLIVSDNLLVASGPLAARGVDYHACGKRAAQLAQELLQRELLALPIEQPDSNTIVINKKTVETLGITIPPALQDNIRYI